MKLNKPKWNRIKTAIKKKIACSVLEVVSQWFCRNICPEVNKSLKTLSLGWSSKVTWPSEMLSVAI